MAHMKQINKLDFSGQDIYVGIDTGKKSWKVTILTKEYEHKTFNQNPNPEELVTYLHKNFPNANYLCAYEAGYFGFWICHLLNQMGVKCIVVHPADIPTKDKEKHNRNDSSDARKIARTLRSGELTPLYVPSLSEQQARSLVRMRLEMKRKETRCKNQIKAMLTFYGVNIPDEMANSHWAKRFILWLENLDSDNQALSALLMELSGLREILVKLTKQIRSLANQEPYIRPVKNLCSVPGISTLTAMVLLTELSDISRFSNSDHLASYVGLSPGEDSSGDKEKTTGLSRRRNGYLRSVLIESSWVAVRKDPALLMSFTELTKRMSKNEAIIRIAHKLLNRIRHVLMHNECYELGIVS
jgi:transposase